MDTTSTSPPLARFRAELYQNVLGLRRDALCELLDAVLSGERATSLVRHSLSPGFRRGWASAVRRAEPTARSMWPALRRLFARHAAPAARGRARAVGAGWLDLAPARGQDQSGADLGPLRHRRHAGEWDHRGLGIPVAGARARGDQAVGACRWRWRGAIWPRARRRRWPSANCARRWRRAPQRSAAAALLDSHYDVVEMVRGRGRPSTSWPGWRPIAASIGHRGPYAGKGAPRKHGPVFRCADRPRTASRPHPVRTTIPTTGWCASSLGAACTSSRRRWSS